MIYHAVVGRTPEWHAARLGCATSSEFHKIIKPAACLKESKSDAPDYSKVLSTQAADYMNRLLAEQLFGMRVHEIDGMDDLRIPHMERGTELEDKAILAYETLTDTETQPGGFITTDDGRLGCSPDRLVSTNGDLELKCPLITTQVGYALSTSVDEDYMVQLQGRMLIHEREWVDIFAWHPRLNIPPKRVYRNDSYIAVMRVVLGRFWERMLEARLKLERDFGPFARPEPEEAPDHSADFVSDEDVDMILAAQRGFTQEGEL